MNYEAKKFDHLLGLEGISEGLLKNHFSLYEGYVNNVNKVSDIMEKLEKDEKSAEPEYAELKRRFGWEWNGMRLHEYYFSNLAKDAKEFDVDSALGTQIKKDFGSRENWEKSFRATGAMRGIGWVILCFDLMTQKLSNIWINEHDTGYLAGTMPLLVLDMFEHAYMPDYGTKKADYIAAFMKAIDWEVVSNRYDLATKLLENKPKGVDHLGCRC